MPNEASGAGWIHDHKPITVSIPPGTAQVSSVLSLPMGFREAIVGIRAVVKVAATGAGASRVLNFRRGSASGTVIATTTYVLADGATVGSFKVIPMSAGDADFLDGDTLTIEWPTAGAVAFTAGELTFIIYTRKRVQQRN